MEAAGHEAAGGVQDRVRAQLAHDQFGVFIQRGAAQDVASPTAGPAHLFRKTWASEPPDPDDFLPLPEFCLKALRMRRAEQIGDEKAAG